MNKLLSAATMALAVTLAPAMVKADYVIYADWNPGGKHSNIEHMASVFDDKGNLKIHYYYDKDWKYLGWDDGKSNPNPESDGKGIEAPNIKNLLAKHKGEIPQLPPEFWKTELGQQIAAHGKGGPVLPAVNPAPDDDAEGGLPPAKGTGGGISPGNPLDPYDPFNPAEQYGMVGGLAIFQFEPNAGSPGEQLQGMGGKEGKKGDPSKPDKKAAAAHGAFGDLPGPPELVNPSWGSKGKGGIANQQPGAAMQLPSAAAQGGAAGITGAAGKR